MRPSAMIRDYKEIWLGTALGVVLIALASWAIQSRIETTARTVASNVLTTVVDVTHQAIRSWAKEQTSEALIWAEHPKMQKFAVDFLATCPTAENLKSIPLQTELRAWLNPVLKAKRFRGYFIIAPDGTNLASTRDANLGIPNLLLAEEGFLEKVWSGKTAVSLPLSSDVPLRNAKGTLVEGAATMFAAAPIANAEGDTIAILTFRIDPKTDFTAILQSGRIGDTGETYAFDNNGRMISESRFRSQLVDIGLMAPGPFTRSAIDVRDPGENLVERKTLAPAVERTTLPLTKMARSAIAGNSGVDVAGYRDYRGVAVIGAWIWDGGLRIGITSEIDVKEAYAPTNGNKRTILYSTVALILLVLGLAMVITRSMEHKKSQRSLLERSDLLRSFLDNISQGVVMFDCDRNLLAWNKQYLTVFPIFKGKLSVGTPNWDMAYMLARAGVYGEGDPKNITDERIEFLWSGESNRGDFWSFGGRIYDVITSRTDLGELVISYTDVTDRRLAEDKVSEQRDELGRLNRQKTRLLSIISHDLRSPFTVLLGYTDLLSCRSHDLDANQIAEICGSINEASNRTLNLMENLLEWSCSQMNETKVESVPQAVFDLAEESIQSLKAVADRKNVDLINEAGDVTAFCDPHMTNTVIRNLISNALKFTDDNGKVTVSAQCLSDCAEIRITDTGIGMSAEQVERLFKLETQQSTTGTRGERGTGLGLLICKDFVEMQDGKLSVESTIGEGSTFAFTLPLHQYCRPQAAKPPLRYHREHDRSVTPSSVSADSCRDGRLPVRRSRRAHVGG